MRRESREVLFVIVADYFGVFVVGSIAIDLYQGIDVLNWLQNEDFVRKVFCCCNKQNGEFHRIMIQDFM